MQINNIGKSFRQRWLINMVNFVCLFCLLGCLTSDERYAREILEAPVIQLNDSIKTLDLTEKTVHNKIVIEKLNGVKLFRVDGSVDVNTGSSKLSNCEWWAFGRRKFTFPWTNHLDRDGTFDEIKIAFGQVDEDKDVEGPFSYNGEPLMAECSCYRWQNKGKKYLFIDTGVSVDFDPNRNYQPPIASRMTIFLESKENVYTKVLDIYFNIPKTKWIMENDDWYLVTSERSWRVVFE